MTLRTLENEVGWADIDPVAVALKRLVELNAKACVLTAAHNRAFSIVERAVARKPNDRGTSSLALKFTQEHDPTLRTGSFGR